MQAITIAMLFGIFAEGILSFFSPCVLPLLPVYLSMMAGGGIDIYEADAKEHRSKMIMNTVFFVLGVSLVFVVLALSFTAIGKAIVANRLLLMRLGGLVIVFLGLLQFGIFESKFLAQERRISFQPKGSMTPLKAFVMGLAFSFGWTPCVGPALASVLLLAAGTQSVAKGILLIAVYSIGFLIPFVIMALFAEKMMFWLREKKKLMGYAVKISGAILVLLGIGLFMGAGNLIDIPMDQTSAPPAAQESSATEQEKHPLAPDFTLQAADGKEYTLSDYNGKVVFLNFWATWCGPCRHELPEVQALYEKMNPSEVIVLTVTLPGGQEKSPEEIKSFVDDEGYTFPVLFDESGNVFSAYGISSFPTTFMIDKKGHIFGYVNGALRLSMMEDIIRQTQEKNS